MTDRAAFSDQEWALLLELPRWVAQAASAAHTDSARHTQAEEEAGLLAIADGRTSPSGFVTQLASELVEVYDEPRGGSAATVIDFGDPAAGIAIVLGHARTVSTLLAAKAETPDAGTYRRWLLAITDTVVGTVRSGTVLGLGGAVVSEDERVFRQQLAQALYSGNLPG